MITEDVRDIEGVDLHWESTALLIKLYSEMGVPIDRMPYTPDMQKLHKSFVEKTGAKVQEGHLYHILIKYRKRGLLPKLRKESDER